MDFFKAAPAYLFCPKNNRHHALWLSGLCAFIDQNGTKLHFSKSWVASSDTCATNDICILRGIKPQSFRIVEHMALLLPTAPLTLYTKL